MWKICNPFSIETARRGDPTNLVPVGYQYIDMPRGNKDDACIETDTFCIISEQLHQAIFGLITSLQASMFVVVSEVNWLRRGE